MRRYEKQVNKKNDTHFSFIIYKKGRKCKSTPAHIIIASYTTMSAKEKSNTFINTAEAHEGQR